ncbi:unnamed protein product [Adineta steineri]|uniref:Uncharacterized protein n=1 Tax=Adineta steineri TaxID=433720 RepID=A0A813SC79_9BILA|nr:unnamed protein product [Adineta steineri]CAF3722988.1 unnamed protein product [Adineta steineri]
MGSNLDTPQDNTKQLRTRFEKVREDIISKLNECSDYIRTIENSRDQAIQVNGDLEHKLANGFNEEIEWKDFKLKLGTTSIKGKVILDVGDIKYTTSIITLTREKNTFFTALFSEQRELERDPNDNSIFIDRNGDLFKHILEYLRTDKIHNDIMTNESLRQRLIIEAKYFCLHNLIHLLAEPERKRQEEEEDRKRRQQEKGRLVIENFFPNGILLQPEHKVKLNKFFGTINQTWELIYKATRDGFGADAFHSHCDNKGPTITIIQSNNNYIFGGYTSHLWTSDGSNGDDRTSFLFTLTNPHNIPPTKYAINRDRVTSIIYDGSGSGPKFGSGCDICISNNSNINNDSYTNFPGLYNDTTGKGNNTFTGARNFTTSEIEISPNPNNLGQIKDSAPASSKDYGRFKKPLPIVNFSWVSPALCNFVTEKNWHFISISTPQYFIVCTIIKASFSVIAQDTTNGGSVTIGINLSNELYDDKNNISMENTMWINGHIYTIDHFVNIETPSEQFLTTQPWYITTVEDNPEIDLAFQPLGSHQQHDNLVIADIQFVQAFGFFNGTIQMLGDTRDVHGGASRQRQILNPDRHL